MLPIYVLTLGLSAGAVGVAGRRALAGFGFVPGLEAGVMLAAGIAFLYIAVQFMYICFLRLLKPTLSQGPMVSEALSHGAAVVLVPHLLDMPLPVIDGFAESDTVRMMLPLAFLGLFACVHVFFKLLTLFWTIQAPAGARFGSLGWVAALGASLLAGAYFLEQWRGELDAARVRVAAEEAHVQVGGAYAEAKRFTEGGVYSFAIGERADRNLVLRFANPPGAAYPLANIYVTLATDGGGAQQQTQPLAMPEEAWATLRVPAEQIPPDATRATLSWSVQREPVWASELGLRPMSTGGREVLVSGPFFHAPLHASAAGRNEDPPNFVVLLVEGLSAQHVSGFGYERNTTPRLDDFMERAIVYTQTFTPAPDAAAAAMTLLTGGGPLRHGYLEERRGPLPEDMRTLPELLRDRGYATVAFTEGDGASGRDLDFGSGFERGFELFDPSAALAPSRGARGAAPAPMVHGGSQHTLRKAAGWLESNRHERFMMFVRLREMQELTYAARYGTRFIQNMRTPRPINVYDSAIQYLDEQIGEFIDQVDRMPGLENTVILITSPYGLDLTGGWRAEPRRILSEPCLRVPLLLGIPGRRGLENTRMITLEDAAVTLAGLAGVSFPHRPAGRDLLAGAVNREPIAMQGDPLHLTLRTRRWRYTWDSGLRPFSQERRNPARPVELLDIEWLERNWRQRDNISRQERLVALYTNRLEEYMIRQYDGLPFDEAEIGTEEAGGESAI